LAGGDGDEIAARAAIDLSFVAKRCRVASLPIFMINLERSAERRARALAAFEAVGVSLILHNAIDGRASDLTKARRYARDTRIARYGADLYSNEIACYLSHLSVMERCLQDGIEGAVILEDDVTPTPRFAETVDQLSRAPGTFEFVRLYGLRKRRAERVCALAQGVDLVWPTHGLCGAQGYYLNAEAMQKILKFGGEITLPYDVMLDQHWRTGLRIFATSPYVISEDKQVSDIGTRPDLWADGSHRWLRTKLKLRKFVDGVKRKSSNASRMSQLAAWRQEGDAAFGIKLDANE
jgi:glycosyl transferase, family 25